MIAMLRRWRDEYDDSMLGDRMWPFVRWHLLTTLPLIFVVLTVLAVVV